MHGLLSGFLENWTSFYSNHAIIRTLIGFFHVGGLVVGGGCAISADRMTLRAARREPAQRIAQLESLRNTHRVVLAGLGAVAVSGFLLFAADSETFLYSVFFWIKMGLILALVANGLLLAHSERQAEFDATRGWRNLTITSSISVVLWMLTTLAGAALPNVG